MAIKGASFASFPDGQTVFGLGSGNLLQPLPIPDGYEACPASAATVLGAGGALGDYLESLVIIPGTTSPGAVSIKDGAGAAITIFAGGATSVADLKPFTLRLGVRASGAGWTVTTGANVTALATGIFA
jgi:hypothetical protein